MLVDLFTNPDSFFEDVAEDGSLIWPLGVVVPVAVVAASTVLPGFLAGQAAESGGGPGSGPGAVFVLFPTATAFVGVVVSFLVYVGFFHGISTVAFGSGGPISESVAVTGWGYAPALLGTHLSLFVNGYVFQTATLPSDPAQLFQATQQIMEGPLVLAAWVLGFVFLLWQSFLWVVGLNRVRGLTLRESAITVAVPFLADVIGRVYFQFFFGP